MQLVLFEALGDVFAVEIAAVREVLRHATRRTVPAPAAWAVGVAEVRGELLVLVDLGVRLGRGPRGIDGDLLLVESGGAVVAVAVDRVLGLERADRVAPAPAGTTEAARGIAMIDERLVLVLDAEALAPPGMAGAPAPPSSAAPARGVGAGAFGPVLTATGPWSPELEAVAREHEVRELVLSEAHGWDGSDVDFLGALPELRAVRILHRRIRDVSGIHRLGGLRDLEVHTRCRTAIDAEAFPQLERCALRWRPRAASVLRHDGLRELVLTHYAARDLGGLGGLRRLERLTLEHGVLERLDGIGALRSLRELRLRSLRRLGSVAGIEDLGIELLEVTNCPALASAEPAGAVPRVLGL